MQMCGGRPSYLNLKETEGDIFQNINAKVSVVENSLTGFSRDSPDNFLLRPLGHFETLTSTKPHHVETTAIAESPRKRSLGQWLKMTVILML